IDGYPTKRPMKLFYCDSLKCLEFLFSNPVFDGHIDFQPTRLYTTAGHLVRKYSEWMTGDSAWKTQMSTSLPDGATLVGAVLSSDKTNLTLGTGNRVAHPLLLSFANLHMDVRMKASENAFLLLALRPCPNFLCAKKLRGVLESRITHHCLDIVCKPLKVAARLGRMMSDPRGYSQFCFTPLTAYIVDNPEAQMLACVGGKSSPVTVSMYKQFGDPFRHKPRMASTTLAQLDALLEVAPNPWDLDTYVKEAKKRHFNGVHRPFWSDWPLSDPSLFLTPEPLHQWHKQCWHHDISWCRNLLGDAEIDFQFSVLQPHIGFQHFAEG
ncbi:hypothetical protein BV25DRAFT_1763953, partial [Artomyces pyxidatus]